PEPAVCSPYDGMVRVAMAEVAINQGRYLAQLPALVRQGQLAGEQAQGGDVRARATEVVEEQNVGARSHDVTAPGAVIGIKDVQGSWFFAPVEAAPGLAAIQRLQEEDVGRAGARRAGVITEQ